MDVICDLETDDPDDIAALCLLAGHPQVRLRGVLVEPGAAAQVGLVRIALERLGIRDMPVGGRPGVDGHVNPFLTTWLGNPRATEPDAPNGDLLAGLLGTFPATTIVTGGPYDPRGGPAGEARA